jgi:methylmalonyl-CoA epimerase
MSIFKKFDHIGIVVEDIEKATKALSDFFDLQPEERMDIEDGGIRMAFYALGVGQMEIIEFQKPMDGVDPLVLQPSAGIQHIAYQVDNFDNALKKLTQKGLKVVKGFPRKGAHGRVAFFYPTERLDFLVEICESSED